MLEKTAGSSLDHRTFQRILSTASTLIFALSTLRPLPTRKRLETGFWQHGGSPFELFGHIPTARGREPNYQDPYEYSMTLSTAGPGGWAGILPVTLAASLELRYPQGPLASLRTHSGALKELLLQQTGSARGLTTSAPRAKMRAKGSGKKGKRKDGGSEGRRMKAKEKEQEQEEEEEEEEEGLEEGEELGEEDEAEELEGEEGGTEEEIETRRWRWKSRDEEVDEELEESSSRKKKKRKSKPRVISQPAEPDEPAEPQPPGPDVGAMDPQEGEAPQILPPARNEKYLASLEATLKDILHGAATEEEPQYSRAWVTYQDMEARQKPRFTNALLQYLSRSDTVANCERVVSLFEELDPQLWSATTAALAIHAQISRGHLHEAMGLFRRVALSNKLDAGFDELLTVAMTRREWDVVKGTWVTWCQHEPHKWSWKQRLHKILDKIEGLDGLVLELKHHYDAPVDAREILSAPLSELIHNAASIAAKSCTARNAAAVLEIAGSAQLYHDYLVRAGTAEEYADFPLIYSRLRAYQDRPPTNAPFVRAVFTGLYPRDREGLRCLHDEFVSHRGSLDSWAYNKYLKYYAHHGDVDKVHELWRRWTTEHKFWEGREILQMPRAYGHLLNVHASRGDVEMTRRAFNEIQTAYNFKPDVSLWNVKLKAEAKANMYPTATHTFTMLCEAVKPDTTSFGTIMGLAGAYGDLEFTVELYKMSKVRSVPTNHYMLAAVVEACCHNDHFQDAERVCQTGAKSLGIKNPMPWNKVLRFYAARCDLNAAHRLVKAMSEHKVEWDDETYEQLLRALVNCRQLHHAYHMLRIGCVEKVFNVTPDHFAIVMAGALRMGDVLLARNVGLRRAWVGLEPTLSVCIHLADAMNRIVMRIHKTRRRDLRNKARREGFEAPALDEPWQISSRKFGRAILDFISTTVKRQRSDTLLREPGGALSEPGDEHKVMLNSRLISRTIFILAQMRDFLSVAEVAELHRQLLPTGSADTWNVPIEVASSFMLSDYFEGRYDRVKVGWEQVFEQARQMSYRGKILQGRRYVLSKPLKTMQTMYIGLKDAEALIEVVQRVRAADFQLDSKNWNIFIVGLVNLGRTVEAFRHCEATLARRWVPWGWTPKERTPTLQERRRRMNPRYLYPTLHTMRVLARYYFRLRKAALWSIRDSESLRIVQEECPRTVRACAELVRFYMLRGTRISAEWAQPGYRESHRDSGMYGDALAGWGMQEEPAEDGSGQAARDEWENAQGQQHAKEGPPGADGEHLATAKADYPGGGDDTGPFDTHDAEAIGVQGDDGMSPRADRGQPGDQDERARKIIDTVHHTPPSNAGRRRAQRRDGLDEH